MGKQNYLSLEEQLKEILNQEEIQRIENPEISAIRQKYWNLRHKAFRDKHTISDSKLESVFDDLITKEQKELEEFRKK